MDVSNQENTQILMTVKETLEILKISRGTLNALPIKKLKIRRRVLYRKKDIDQFIHDNLQEVKNESNSK